MSAVLDRALPATIRHWPVLLVWSCLLLLPLGRSVEVPVLLMALLGAARLVRDPRGVLAEPGVRLLGAVFLACWVPVLVSIPGAVEPARSAEIALNHLRFLLAGIFVVGAVASAAALALLLRLSAWLLAFWMLDALVQQVRGVDLFGVPAWPGRLSAMFGEGNAKFGVILAVFVPLAWEHARRHWPGWITAALFVGSLSVVVLGGSRAAWINGAVAAAAWLVAVWVRAGGRPLRAVLVVGLGLSLAGGGTYLLSERVASGVEDALAGLSLDPQAPPNSIHHRLWIWAGAVEMFRENPVTGVGARGFRYAFADHARSDDPYLGPVLDQPPTHSHQILLEVATETGTVGLAGLLIAWGLLARVFVRASPEARLRLLPFGVALLAAYFPLNTHFAVYSAYWSQILWYLVALYCAAAWAEAGGADRGAAVAP